MTRLRLLWTCALTLAATDAWLGAISGTDSLRILAGCAGATFVAALPLFGLAVLLPRRPATRVGLCVFAGVTVVAGHLLAFREPPFTRIDLQKALFAAAAGLIAAVLAGLSRDRLLERPAWRRTAATLALAAPFVVTQTALAAWLTLHGRGAGGRANLAIVLGGWVVVAAATLALARLAAARRATGWIFGAAGLLLVAALVRLLLPAPGPSAARSGTPPPGAPDVILITIDTLRADRVPADGAGRVPTPGIDLLAADGLRFAQARSTAPWTLPAMASIMTGLPPDVHLANRRDSRLVGVETLAELLRGAGYRTAAIGVNPVLRPQVGLGRGFDEYRFYPLGPPRGRSIGARLLRVAGLEEFDHRTRSTARLTDEALAWLARRDTGPFFLWLHYFDPHAPYAPPARYLSGEPPTPRIGRQFFDPARVRTGVLAPTPAERAWLETLYDAEVRYVDDNVGRLLAGLRTLDLYDHALVVLTSDHGEEFWEHGAFEHGHSLYDELLRVPLIVKPPGASGGATIDVPVSTEALFSTVLDSCGVAGPERPLRSLIPLPGAAPTPEAPLVAGFPLYFDDRVALVAAGFKYVLDRDTGEELLFDLAGDPGEQHSLAAEEPARLASFREQLRAQDELAAELRRRLGLDRPEALEVDAPTEELLRSLGYVQ